MTLSVPPSDATLSPALPEDRGSWQKNDGFESLHRRISHDFNEEAGEVWRFLINIELIYFSLFV